MNFIYASKQKLSVFTFIATVLILTCNAGKAQETDNKNQTFNYLEFKDGKIVSTHAIQMVLDIPAGFRQIQPHSYKPVFNGHPFNVTFAAVVNKNTIIMVHAEKVTDDSGFLDYIYMAPVELDGFKFFKKEHCLKLTEEIYNKAVDIKFISDNGFDFGEAIYLKQFFINSPDGNYEYVISYGERVCNCNESSIDEDFLDTFNKNLKNNIKLTGLQ